MYGDRSRTEGGGVLGARGEAGGRQAREARGGHEQEEPLMGRMSFFHVQLIRAEEGEG